MKRDFFVSRVYLIDESLQKEWEEKIKTLNFKGKGYVSLTLCSKKLEYWANYDGDIKVEVSDDYMISISDTISFEEFKKYLLENGCLEESTVRLNDKIRCNSGMSIFCTKHDKEGKALMKKMRSLLFKNVNTVNIEASDKEGIDVVAFPRFYGIRVNALSDFETVKKYLYENGFLENSPYTIDKKFMKEETFTATLSFDCDIDVLELYEKIANPLDDVLKENKIGYVDGNEIGFGVQLFITMKNNKPATIKKLIKICKDFIKSHGLKYKFELSFEDEVYDLQK